jgi:signal transduction histidine kinase
MREDDAALSEVGFPERDNGGRVRAGDGARAGDDSLARVVQAVDKERERLGRDLHDGVQQRLAAVRVRLNIAEEMAAGDHRLRRTLREIAEDLDAAIEELREVAQGVQPQVLTKHGLVAALAQAARVDAGSVNLNTAGLSRYPAELESAIYYCCREALQNAAKHGGPSARTSILLHEEADSVSFEVSDDGLGFDVAKATGGRGLQHMRDRMRLVGGRLSIVSRAGVGTVVSGVISPVPQPLSPATGTAVLSASECCLRDEHS